jgi:hypothetical protein
MPNKIHYKLIVEDEHFINALWEKFIHSKRKPTKRWWVTQEDFEDNLERWEGVNESMVNSIVILYKYHFPEIYDDFQIHNFGFTSGHKKTFYLYISKYMSENDDYEEHA